MQAMACIYMKIEKQVDKMIHSQECLMDKVILSVELKNIMRIVLTGMRIIGMLDCLHLQKIV